ncbi:MAG: hypothetical protein ABSE79_08075 [Terriglobia bacterium]
MDTLTVQLDGIGLVPTPQDFVVVLQFVHGRQLHAVILKLDRGFHLPVGVATGDIRVAAAHPPRWFRGPNSSRYG